MSSLTSNQFIAFIERELGKVPGPAKKNHNYYNIVCPFHTDSDPSCGVCINPTRGLGNYRCLGCGAKGPWNTLAEKLNLNTIKEGQKFFDDHLHFDKNQYAELLELDGDMTVDKLLKVCGHTAAIPWNPQQDWRGFKGKFLVKFGALSAIKSGWDKATGRRYTTNMLFFPVWVGGDLVGGFTARLKKSKKKGVPSYINSPGEWSKHTGLFPYDYVERMIIRKGLNFVVLVEGPRDALFLIKKGIPALCILGTNAFTEKKARVVTQLPIERVWVLGDGDEAGRKMNRKLKKMLKPLIETRAVRIPITKERYDPCSLPYKMRQKLFKVIRGSD